jgi:hypothetical protein
VALHLLIVEITHGLPLLGLPPFPWLLWGHLPEDLLEEVLAVGLVRALVLDIKTIFLLHPEILTPCA